MKKVLLTALSLVLALGMSACANEPKEPETVEPTYTAGTYTSTTRGMKGDITVEVTVDETSIKDVKVTAQSETYGVGYGMAETPVEAVTAAIVANQSLGVDMVTGATITSRAIITAASDALTQAGADVEALKAVAVTKDSKDEELTADVVVVGAGAAGMAAAIEASQAGANVIVLEKQGITGGCTTLSGGKLVAAGSKYQIAQGFEGDTPEALFDYLKGVGGEAIDDAKLRQFTDNALMDVEWLEGLGVNMINVEPIHSSITPWRVINTYGGGGQTDGIGGQISVPLYNKLMTTDADVYFNVTANEILMKDGAAAGVKGVRPDGTTVTVHANNVIIATGGFAQNREMTAHLGIPGYVTSIPKGHVGDGVKMATAVGADYYQADGVQEVFVSFTCGVGINEESGLIVTDKGQRVVDEWTYQSHVATALRNAGAQTAYYIASAADPNPTVQYGMMMESTPRAESAEELAKLIGIDPETLKATVDRYNELCAKGVDEDFNKPAQYMVPLEGTLYAIQMNSCYTVTFGGLVTNLDAQVLTADGTAIPGLYAAGEVAHTGLFGGEYPSCGVAIGAAVRYGRIAGTNTAK